MRLSPPSFTLVLAALLAATASACTPGSPAVPGPTSDPGAPPVVVAATPTPSPAVQAFALVGEARYFGAPLTDADVTVTPVGLAAPSITGKTDARGGFAVDVPAGVAPGTTLRIVVRQGVQHAATLVKAPARSLSDIDPALIADEIGAYVYLTFGPRFAAIKALADAPPADPAIEAAGLAIFRATVDALRAAGTRPDRAAFERASVALDGASTVLDGATRDALLEAHPAAALATVRSAGQQLNDLIRTQVLVHMRPMPPAEFLGPIPLTRDASANDTTSAVFPQQSSSSSHQRPTAQGAVGFEPAPIPLGNETAVPTISTSDDAN